MTTPITDAEIERLKADPHTGRLIMSIIARMEMAEGGAEHMSYTRLQASLSETLMKLKAAKEEVVLRSDFMESRGYRRCDIAACNCGSWHGGYAERRLHEAIDAIHEAGGSTNGVILTDAIMALGAARDSARAEGVAECEQKLKTAEADLADARHQLEQAAETMRELEAALEHKREVMEIYREGRADDHVKRCAFNTAAKDGHFYTCAHPASFTLSNGLSYCEHHVERYRKILANLYIATAIRNAP